MLSLWRAKPEQLFLVPAWFVLCHILYIFAQLWLHCNIPFSSVRLLIYQYYKCNFTYHWFSCCFMYLDINYHFEYLSVANVSVLWLINIMGKEYHLTSNNHNLKPELGTKHTLTENITCFWNIGNKTFLFELTTAKLQQKQHWLFGSTESLKYKQL